MEKAENKKKLMNELLTFYEYTYSTCLSHTYFYKKNTNHSIHKSIFFCYICKNLYRIVKTNIFREHYKYVYNYIPLNNTMYSCKCSLQLDFLILDLERGLF